MKLQVQPRSVEKKREAKRQLREGFIPAVIYTRGQNGETISLNAAEFNAALRKVLPGRLPTTVFTLVSKGREHKAIIKDIQYNVTNYAVVHLDFEELHPDVKVDVKVPIEYTGVVDCVGIKLGGVLRQVIRHVKVRCLPKDIPSYFELDVRELALFQHKKLSELDIPQNVMPLTDLKEVAVVIAKR